MNKIRLLRLSVREVRIVIERIVNEELEAALGVGFYQRDVSRQGYRHGYEARQISTRLVKLG